MAIGSVRSPGTVKLQWEMFFWHPTELSAKGKPIERDKKLHSSFEKITGQGQSISVVLHDGETEIFNRTIHNHEVTLDPLPEGRLTVRLTPSDKLRSDMRAGPHLDSKGGQFNKFFDIMFRPVEFDIEVNGDGEVIGPAPDRLAPVRDPAPEPEPGQMPRPAPGPHAYVFIDTAPAIKKGIRGPVILVDWKPDWISRHSPRLRPTPVDRQGNDIREVVLHITTGPRIAGAFRKFLGHESGSKSGIHYIVDLDAHITKLLHERHGANHAGYAPEKGPQHLAAWGEGEDAALIARTSIGIEHVAAPNDEWPEAQITASIDLVRQLSRHFGVEPRDVIGHNDVIVLKSNRALPRTTKPCPAGGLPWERYAGAGLSLAADTTFEPPEDIYGGIFGMREFLDGGAPAEVIEELQEDLHRIGWWLPAKLGGRRRSGTFDDSTEAGVTRFQARFMARQGLKFTANKVDRATARTIKRVVANLG